MPMKTPRKKTAKQNLLILIGALLFLSGCRFGNHTDTPRQINTNRYKGIELFATEPRRLIAEVYLNDDTVATADNAPLTAMPIDILQTISNPVLLLTPENASKPPFFINPYTLTSEPMMNPWFQTRYDRNGAINLELSSNISQFGDNPNCLTQSEVIQSGLLDRSRPSTITNPNGSTTKVDGRLSLSYTHIQVFDGECKQILEELALCYQTGNNCSTTRLEVASALYDLYVRQTGILDLSNVSKIKGLVYTARFE